MKRAKRRRLARHQAKRDNVSTPQSTGNLQRELLIGADHQRAGRLARARTIYQRILARRPDHADANHLLGVIAFQSGRQEDSPRLISRAIDLDPSDAFYYGNMGLPLQELGRLDDSVACYRKAIASYGETLAMRPDYVEAHVNMGISLRRLGRLDEAIASFQKAIAYGVRRRAADNRVKIFNPALYAPSSPKDDKRSATMLQLTEISPDTVHRWVGDGEALLVDVREANELAQARLEKAVHVPMSAFDADRIPSATGKKVVFICARGTRSEQVRQYVVAQGILADAYNLAGGLMAWAEAGLPMETGPLSSP